MPVDDAPRTGVAPKADTAGIAGIARGGGLNVAGSAFNQLLRFAITFLLARVLGETQTGLYFQAFAVLSLLGILASFGFTQSLTRFVALYRADEDGAALRGVVRLGLLIAAGIATLMGAALFAGSTYVATEIFHDAQMVVLLRLVALALPSTVYPAPAPRPRRAPAAPAAPGRPPARLRRPRPPRPACPRDRRGARRRWRASRC